MRRLAVSMTRLQHMHAPLFSECGVQKLRPFFARGKPNSVRSKSFPPGSEYLPSHPHLPHLQHDHTETAQVASHLPKTKYPRIRPRTLEKSGWRQERGPASEDPSPAWKRSRGRSLGESRLLRLWELSRPDGD